MALFPTWPLRSRAPACIGRPDGRPTTARARCLHPHAGMGTRRPARRRDMELQLGQFLAPVPQRPRRRRCSPAWPRSRSGWDAGVVVAGRVEPEEAALSAWRRWAHESRHAWIVVTDVVVHRPFVRRLEGLGWVDALQLTRPIGAGMVVAWLATTVLLRHRIGAAANDLLTNASTLGGRQRRRPDALGRESPARRNTVTLAGSRRHRPTRIEVTVWWLPART